MEMKIMKMNKPCKVLHYCPYGSLVEEAPLAEDFDDTRICRVFGHVCPVYVFSELIEDLEDE
jgi:hypothetical protein